MSNHDELLEEAVAAQWRYEISIEKAKEERAKVFRRVLAGPVTAVELGKELGLSNSHVARIARGQ